MATRAKTRPGSVALGVCRKRPLVVFSEVLSLSFWGVATYPRGVHTQHVEISPVGPSGWAMGGRADRNQEGELRLSVLAPLCGLQPGGSLYCTHSPRGQLPLWPFHMGKPVP